MFSSRFCLLGLGDWLNNGTAFSTSMSFSNPRKKIMEVENAVPLLFNQSPNPKRQKREENIDYDEESREGEENIDYEREWRELEEEDIDYERESRDLMTELKVAREKVSEYLNNKWKDLSFEDQVNEGWNLSLDDFYVKYAVRERHRLKLMEGVKKEDILKELKLYVELQNFCHAQYGAFRVSVIERRIPQWFGIMRKLSKIENVHEKLLEDKAVRRVHYHTIFYELETIADRVGKEVDIGETTYEDLRNRLDKLADMDYSCKLISAPFYRVCFIVASTVMFLENVVLLKKLAEERELDPGNWMN